MYGTHPHTHVRMHMIHVCIYIHTLPHRDTHRWTDTNTHTYAVRHTYAQAHTYTLTPIHTCTDKHTCTERDKRTHAHTYTHAHNAHVHTYTHHVHTHLHTYIHSTYTHVHIDTDTHTTFNHAYIIGTISNGQCYSFFVFFNQIHNEFLSKPIYSSHKQRRFIPYFLQWGHSTADHSFTLASSIQQLCLIFFQQCVLLQQLDQQ